MVLFSLMSQRGGLIRFLFQDIDNFDSALATTSLAANAVLELQCKLDYIPGTKVNVMLLRDFEGSRHIEMYCHQRFRVLSGPPWRDVVFGTKVNGSQIHR